MSNDSVAIPIPRVFLSHAHTDKHLAQRLAFDLRANGIETFFDEWEIGLGDSIPQKLMEALGQCTHFLVLLTPNSMSQPWVNFEIDAGLVGKMAGLCRFCIILHNLEPQKLPLALRAFYSLTIENYDEDILRIVADIYGLSRTPELGPMPKALSEGSAGRLGLSPAAEQIAEIMVKGSNHGRAGDPQLRQTDVRATGLSDETIVDAIDELQSYCFIDRKETLTQGPLGFNELGPTARLFLQFDKAIMGWDHEADALTLARDIVNGQYKGYVPEIAENYGWTPRRINPAIDYLIEEGLLDLISREINNTWRQLWLRKSPSMRRWVQSRS